MLRPIHMIPCVNAHWMWNKRRGNSLPRENHVLTNCLEMETLQCFYFRMTESTRQTTCQYLAVFRDSSIPPCGVGCGMGRNCIAWLLSLPMHFNRNLLQIHFQFTSQCGLIEYTFDEHRANAHPMDLWMKWLQCTFNTHWKCYVNGTLFRVVRTPTNTCMCMCVMITNLLMNLY